MTFEEFQYSLRNEAPAPVSQPLNALWYAGKGDWDTAHVIAQDIYTWEGSWIHAYLHRVEGDEGNARYWYHKAGKKMPSCSLQEEWASIVRELLDQNKM